ncbi:MAG TPA: protein kinase [Ramlibacter sp.]|nr:protein kinase [Ramlibacter sp.]
MSEIPATIGKYTVEREVGRGASSTVYLGFDRFNLRPVAIKQIHSHLLTDPQQTLRYRRRLRNEAQMAGQLNHPHIVRLFDADEDADPPYLVLEYIDGSALASFAAPDRLLPVAQVLDIAFKCCSALEHAQQKGLVHRDIKPANLILQENGDVKVTDFGTALSLRSEVTQLTGLVGSPSYMSPEQVREQVCSHQSDMFSLGIVVYELLTGRNPFEGENDFTTLYKVNTEMPSPPCTLRPDLPPLIDQVVMKALAKAPKDRYPEWADFGDALLSVSRILPERRARDRDGERFAQMRALPFFREFHDATLWEALRLGTLHSYRRGDILMREETEGDSFSILLEGHVAVKRGTFLITVLGPGVTLGEMTYLQPENPMRTATAVAESEVLALEIRNAGLRQASESLQTGFDKAFIKLLVSRLIKTNAQIGNWDLLAGQVQ